MCHDIFGFLHVYCPFSFLRLTLSCNPGKPLMNFLRMGCKAGKEVSLALSILSVMTLWSILSICPDLPEASWKKRDFYKCINLLEVHSAVWKGPVFFLSVNKLPVKQLSLSFLMKSKLKATRGQVERTCWNGSQAVIFRQNRCPFRMGMKRGGEKVCFVLWP